jgi:succinate dehydrogenase / fumarate reductase, cytochrome b subunit
MSTPLKEKSFEGEEKLKLPQPFAMRRLHSLLGLWLVLYLFEHLLVNSQAALFFDDEGFNFIAMVNTINALPYLKVVELLFLGIPFFIHGVWGTYYAWIGKLNAHKTDGSKPALPQYRRNKAYSWQRITSWLLIVGILAHVLHMRFLHYPQHVQQGDKKYYFSLLPYDQRLPMVAEKIGAKIYDDQQLENLHLDLKENEAQLAELKNNRSSIESASYYKLLNQVEEQKEWLHTAQKKPLNKGEVLVVTPNAGSAFLLIVRETFTHPLMVLLYSILVVAAVFHAFNGVWTLAITWGFTLTRLSQRRLRAITNVLMGIVMFLGLMAAWGTYWSMQLLE